MALRSLERGTIKTQRENYQKVLQVLGLTPAVVESQAAIHPEHPALVGLNDDDLLIAQGYSRARTSIRQRVDRLLLHRDDAPDLQERFEALPAERQTVLMQVFEMFAQLSATTPTGTVADAEHNNKS